MQLAVFGVPAPLYGKRNGAGRAGTYMRRKGGAPWVNSHSECRVSLFLVPDFDTAKPNTAELGVLEALLPELMTALLDIAPDDEG